MISRARYHYPFVRDISGERLLYSPVSKKRYKTRPEERVRQAVIQYMMLEASVSPTRMSNELPVKSLTGDSENRADILVYDAATKPFILIECKAEEVRLGPGGATQIARYNSEIGAPYLILTNGKQDLIFNIQKGTPQICPSWPLGESGSIKRDFTYWVQRGFLADTEGESRREWLAALCLHLFGSVRSNTISNDVRFMKIPNRRGLFLDHYFNVQSHPQYGLHMAITLTRSRNNRNWLACLCTAGNKKLLVGVDLDKWLDGEKVSGFLIGEDLDESLRFSDYAEPGKDKAGRLSDKLPGICNTIMKTLNLK